MTDMLGHRLALAKGAPRDSRRPVVDDGQGGAARGADVRCRVVDLVSAQPVQLGYVPADVLALRVEPAALHHRIEDPVPLRAGAGSSIRSEEHTSELQSP